MKSKYAVLLAVFLSVSVHVPLVQAQVTNECSFSTSDADGDGYGWENFASCVVAAPSASECIDTPPFNDGWGWNGSASCRVATLDIPIASDSSNEPCIDTDGDGWGWSDLTGSCEIPADTADDNAVPAAPECIDEDGDGWGWDGAGSCLATDNNAETASDAISAVCIDDDGDGWGWNGEASCLTSESNTELDGIVTGPGYSRAEIDRFVNLTTINEFSGNRHTLFKYPNGASVTWSIQGNYSRQSYSTTVSVFSELSQLTDLSFTEVDGDADIDIHIAVQSDFNDIANMTVPAGQAGFFRYFYYYSQARDAFTIADAIILIDENYDQLAKDHLLREEITQSLGLSNDDYEPDSMFYQLWSYTQEYSDSGKVMMDIMYRSGVTGGMSDSDIYDFFGY